MSQNKKGLELVKEINAEWYFELQKDSSLGILMYEPFSEQYWTEKYKIVLCNLEPGGDKPEDKKILDLECFEYWFDKKNPTIKRSAKFIYCLYNTLLGKSINKNDLETVKNDKKLLFNCMKKATYMNLLQDVGDGKFDRKYFWDFYAKENIKNRENIFNLINALIPDIFIVTSEGGDLIEQLFNNKFENHVFIYNNKLFVNLGHPSVCFTDDYVLNNVNIICEHMKIHNLLKE